jgi:hypothetical protein
MALAGMVGTLALAQAADAECLTKGQVIAGKFEWVSATHPNGTPIRAPFVILSKAACEHDFFGSARGTRVQLALHNIDEMKNIRPGTMLTIRADYGTPETAWHIGDIIAFNAKIVSAH